MNLNGKFYYGLDYAITDFMMDLEQQVKKQKEAINKIDNYINNYDVFKVFSFPLMKRWEEQQVKSSIDYEFKTSLIKDLKDILKEVSEWKQLEFYKDLSEQLQQENNQLKLINKEHQQINGELRQANKLLNEQYIRLYKEYEQQERIKYLERSNNRREDIILEQRQEINDLEDNWNMLKEYIRKNIIYDDVGMKILDPSPLEDYMQELEGSDSNE